MESVNFLSNILLSKLKESFPIKDPVVECTHQDSEEWLKAAHNLYQIKQILKEYEKMEKIVSEELRILSDNRSAMGGGYIYECTIRQGSVDYKAIPELKRVNLEKYRKEESAVWKLFKIKD
jgi:hypothetical protein